MIILNLASRLEGLQVGGGGQPDQFTTEQANRLKDLVYDSLDYSLSNNVNIFEKGVATNITFSHSIEPDDDTVLTASFDGVDILANLIDSVVFNGVVNTLTKSMSITVDSGQTIPVISSTAWALVPQYTGITALSEPLYDYASLGAFTKLIQSSLTITKSFVLANQYGFFISNSSSATITDTDTNFSLTVGAWASTTDFFIKKSVVITLADGSTENVTIYRTRELLSQTLNVRIN